MPIPFHIDYLKRQDGDEIHRKLSIDVVPKDSVEVANRSNLSLRHILDEKLKYHVNKEDDLECCIHRYDDLVVPIFMHPERSIVCVNERGGQAKNRDHDLPDAKEDVLPRSDEELGNSVLSGLLKVFEHPQLLILESLDVPWLLFVFDIRVVANLVLLYESNNRFFI